MTIDPFCALFLRYAIIRSSWTYLIFFSFTKATFKQYLPCSPECLFIQQLFLLFLRTISLFGCSKIHRLDSVILRKNGSSCIFTSSGMLPIPKIFIKVIRGLPALEVLNFQSWSFLNALKYTESWNYLQNLPEIKLEAGPRA